MSHASPIKKQDLGWSKDSKVVVPVDAEQIGEITVKDLSPLAPGPVGDWKQSNGDSTPIQQASATPKFSKPKSDVSKSAPSSTIKNADKHPETHQTPRLSSAVAEQSAQDTAASEKTDKKKKKKRGTPNEDSSNVPEIQEPTAAVDERVPDTAEEISPSKTAHHTLRSASHDEPKADKTQPVADGDSINVGISGDFLEKELKKIETGVSKEFHKVLNRELENLYRRIDDDKRVQDAAGSAKQDAMLRLVSSTLTGNVDKALARIIEANIRQSGCPSRGRYIGLQP